MMKLMKKSRRILAMILAIAVPASMMLLTSCSKEEDALAAAKEDTIGTWSMTTEQEDVFERITALTGTQGSFWQFNVKDCTLELSATHYVDGEEVESGAIASYAVSGNGNLFINYQDTSEGDVNDLIGEDDVDNEVTAIITSSVISDSGEDGSTLQFNVRGLGSTDSQLAVQSKDDSWETLEEVPITYGEAMDLWAIDLSAEEGAGSMEGTVSGTLTAWKKNECVIITAKFIEYDEDSEEADGESEGGEGAIEGMDDGLDEELTVEQGKEILEEIEEAEEAMKED